MDSQNLGGLIIFQNVRWSGPFLRLLRNVLIILQYYENNFIQTYLYKYILHSRPVRFEQNTTCNSSRQESASINGLQIACREFLHAKNCQTAAAKGIPQILCTKMTSQNIANFFFFILLHGVAKLLEHGQHSHDCMDTSHDNDTFIHWCLPVFGFPQSQNTIRNLRPIFIAKNMNTFQNLTSYDVMLRQWNIFTFHVKNELHLSNKRLKKISVAVIQTHVW